MRNFLLDHLNELLASLIILLAAFTALFLVDYSVLSDRLAALGYTPDENMSTLIDDIDLSSRAELILFASHPVLQSATDFRLSCPVDATEATVIGCYNQNQIYVYNINREELAGIEQSTLAHELLHAVWDRLSESERQTLSAELANFYAAHQSELEPYLLDYSGDKLYDELHSLVGVAYSSTGSELLDEHYGSFFGDRQKLAAYFESYHQTFQDLNQQLSQLYGIIQSSQSELETLLKDYSSQIATLNTDIQDFNSKASSGSFATQEEFDAERNILLQRQASLDALRQQINDLSSSTNSLINEYNSLVFYTSELLESTDARLDNLDIRIGN